MTIPWRAYYELTKPRIVFMVLITAVWGYFLGGDGSLLAMLSTRAFWSTMAGVALAAGGGAVLNQYLEREPDGNMKRTRHRPLPTGLVRPTPALVFGLWLTLLGLAILLLEVNLLTAFLVLFTNFLYVLVYTPMKRMSALNTTFGAIPGAMPPLIGWTAAQGGIATEGILLFLILFAWQHPHVYAIGWMYREEFARAGFKMLARDDDDGSRTVSGVVVGTLALIVVSVLPVWNGMAGYTYGVVALLLGGGVLWCARRLARTRSVADAKAVMAATIIYLPLILAGIVIDALLQV